MFDRIKTTTCATCGNLAPVNGPHYCRDERRETLADVNASRVFVDLLAR